MQLKSSDLNEGNLFLMSKTCSMVWRVDLLDSRYPAISIVNMVTISMHGYAYHETPGF